MNLQHLPTEILRQCFKYESLFDLLGTPDNYKIQLKALRLTSKRFATVCAPLLFNFARVYAASDSLDTLEEMSRHPLISKSIRTVEVNASCYSASVVEYFALFADNCATSLGRILSGYEQVSGDFDTDPYWKGVGLLLDNAWRTHDDWSAITDDEYDEDNLTPAQVMLDELYQEYCRRFDDQESFKHERKGWMRVGAAFHRLEGLRGLKLCEEERKRIGNVGNHFAISEKGIMDDCLKADQWAAAEFIPDLFWALHHFSVFPTEFEIAFTIRHELDLQMPKEKLNYITQVLRQATKLSIDVSDHTYRNDGQPVYENQHLGNFIRTFLDAKALQSLTLKFRSIDRSQVAMSQILPATRTSFQLHTLVLSRIAFHQCEGMTLIERNHMTLKMLRLEQMYLLSGTWADMIEALRCLEKLEEVSCYYPGGGEFAPGFSDYHYPQSEVREYILRKRTKNPLIGLRNN
jgi:hypothetical protein